MSDEGTVGGHEPMVPGFPMRTAIRVSSTAQARTRARGAGSDQPRPMTRSDRAALAQQPFDDDEPIRVRLRSPGDLVASLPALLGFHARRSIVLVVLGGSPSVVHLTMRLDLPDGGDETTWRAIAACFARAVRRADAHHAMLLVLDGEEEPTRALADAMHEALHPIGVDLADVILVADGRYRSLTCRDATCCPPEGTPVPASSSLTAAVVTQGRVIHGDRAEIEAQLAPPDPKAQARAERVAALVLSSLPGGSLGVTDDEVRELLDRCVATANDSGLRLVDAVRLAMLVQISEVRDLAYRHMLTVGSERHEIMWSAVCRQVPASMSAVPLALVGLSSYLSGAGALTTVAIQRAVEVDGCHPTVTLISDVVQSAIPPRDVRDALARSLSGPG